METGFADISSISKKEWRVQNEDPGKHLKEALRHKNKACMSNFHRERGREFQLAAVLKNRVKREQGLGGHILMLDLQSHLGEKVYANIIQAKNICLLLLACFPLCLDMGIIQVVFLFMSAYIV